MDGKKLLLFGILVIASGAAFVYFDPMELDLLGLKQKPAVAKPAAAAHAPTPAAKPAVVPRAAAVTAQSKAAVALPFPAPAATPAPKAAVVAIQAKTPEGAKPSNAAVPPAMPSASPVVAIARVPQPPLKLSETAKPAGKPERPKNLDMRHCLDMENDAAIAKCAGE